MEENNFKDFHCNICDKYYSSIQSLSNHRRIKHCNHNVTKNVTNKNACKLNVTKSVTKSDRTSTIINNQLNESADFTKQACKYCNKMLANRHSKWRHEQNCKLSNECDKIDNTLKVDTNNKIDKDEEIQELKKENAEIKSMLMELLKRSKVHPKTLEKINKNLIKNQNNNNINGDSNNVNINSGTVNNINIIKFGNENINQILDQKEKLKILEARFLSLEESIKRIHFNDARPEYQNILITNLRDDLAYVFDGGKFVTTKKTKAITELIDNHIDSIEISLEEYKEKLNPRVVEKLEELIDKINDDYTQMVVENNNNKKFQNYKLYKIDQVKELIYDESKHIKDNKKIVQIPSKKKSSNEIEV